VNRVLYVVVFFLWLVISGFFSLYVVGFFLPMASYIFGSWMLGTFFALGSLLVVFFVLQYAMYKSGILSRRKLETSAPQGSFITKTQGQSQFVSQKEPEVIRKEPEVEPTNLGERWFEEQGGYEGVVKNLKKVGDSTYFLLKVSGDGKPVFQCEANIGNSALKEGDTVFVKGSVDGDGILRPIEFKNLSNTATDFSEEPSTAENDDLSEDIVSSDSIDQGDIGLPAGRPKTSAHAVGPCPMCKGTGVNRVMVMRTVMEPQTVYEQQTQYQFGRPVRVTVPRTVMKPVQKQEYKIVPCPKCKPKKSGIQSAK
jgi:hypothetical protein